jgi:hypothetical protein
MSNTVCSMTFDDLFEGKDRKGSQVIDPSNISSSSAPGWDFWLRSLDPDLSSSAISSSIESIPGPDPATALSYE